MPFVGKYLEISTLEKPPKTSVYVVKSRHQGTPLGIIRWHGPWRQYVFEVGETIWSDGCLQDLVNFLGEKKRERSKLSPKSDEKETKKEKNDECGFGGCKRIADKCKIHALEECKMLADRQEQQAVEKAMGELRENTKKTRKPIDYKNEYANGWNDALEIVCDRITMYYPNLKKVE